MKNLLFTAIALFAFTFVSFANTISEVNFNDNKKTELVKSEVAQNQTQVMRIYVDPCLGAYVSTYNANVSEYGSAVASQIAAGAWNACRKALGLEED